MVEPVADSSVESLADEPRPTVEPVASEAARVADLQRQEQTLRQR